MTGPSATATSTTWEVRYHAADGSSRVVASGTADGILDALRWIVAVSPCKVERYEAEKNRRNLLA